MRPISPIIPDKNLPEVVVAEHQDEYQNLPAVRLEGGIILCRWKLDEAERAQVAQTGDIYLLQWTGGGLVTPMLLQTEPPEILQPTNDHQPVEPEKVQMMTAVRRSSEMVNDANRLGFTLFENNCSKCDCVVIYTEKTVETLAANPELNIICTVCFEQMQKENPELKEVCLPNTRSEIEQILVNL